MIQAKTKKIKFLNGAIFSAFPFSSITTGVVIFMINNEENDHYYQYYKNNGLQEGEELEYYKLY